MSRRFFFLAAVLTAVFALPLYELVRLSFRSELHSHLLLIPVVSWYIWRFIDGGGKRKNATGSSEAIKVGRGVLTAPDESANTAGVSTPHPGALGRARPTSDGASLRGAMVASVLGVAFLAGYFLLRIKWKLPVTEYLWAGILGYLLLLLAAAVRRFGWGRLKEHSFAVAFLAFFIPLPMAVTDFMSVALQRGSAEVTDWMLQLSGLPVLRTGLVFQLPGMTLQIAEECSGVRSTLVLFMTSLIAGKMFLRAGWKRPVLALLTVPLGLLRNALRITVLSWLSVHVDPGIIHGPLHHQGGPVFFVLSLIPLFALLWYFKRSESSKSPVKS